jgi:hypothetical protein
MKNEGEKILKSPIAVGIVLAAMMTYKLLSSEKKETSAQHFHLCHPSLKPQK